MRIPLPIKFSVVLGMLVLCGCDQSSIADSALLDEAKVSQDTKVAKILRSLPPPRIKTVVSVYDFQDLTGQLKPNNNFAEYSKAITQGGLAILNKTLLQAGDGTWFSVVERGGLKNLVQERQIIDVMRKQYPGPNGQPVGVLPPMLYSGMLIEGGVVGYDANIVTGGVGANYLGIGGNVSYSRDIATVDLRAVSVATGEILMSVTAEKTIYSTSLQGSVYKYVAFDKLLQAEAGVSTNEPPQLAVRKAIQTAVYSLIMEGVRKGLWQFADDKTGKAALADYMKNIPEEDKPPVQPASTNAVQLPQLPPTSNQSPNSDSSKLTNDIFQGLKSAIPTDNGNAAPPPASPVYPVPPVQQKSTR